MAQFFPGKIYATQYSNWKHDSKPLTFVMFSNAMKTHALNLHYFPQPLMIQFISFTKKFAQKFPTVQLSLGRVLYRIMKQYYPMWIKKAYRTYHSNMLNGYLVNEGVTMPMNLINQPIASKELANRDIQAQNINSNMSKMPSKPAPVSFFKMK